MPERHAYRVDVRSSPCFCPPVQRLRVFFDGSDDVAFLHVLADGNGGGDGKVRRPDVPPADAVTD